MKRLLLIGAILIGAIVMMPPDEAFAAPNDENMFMVCDTLNETPSFKGLDMAGFRLLGTGIDAQEAGETLYKAVNEICPQFSEMASEWSQTPTPPSTEPMGPPSIGGAVLR